MSRKNRKSTGPSPNSPARGGDEPPRPQAGPAAEFPGRLGELGRKPWWPWLLAAALVAVTLLAYLPALRAGFIWDDDTFLTNNRLIQAPDGLYRFWFTTEPPDYFPLTSTMLWIEWRLWGMNATGYHVVNVLLHAIGALLLWRVLKRLAVPGAYAVALIFAVHPVTVESAAWITERKNVLPFALYPLALLLYLRFEDTGRPRRYFAALVVFLLALLAKTSVVMLPVVLLMLAWWRRRRIAGRDVLRSAPFFALAAVLAVATWWFQSHRAIRGAIRTDGFLSRVTIAGKAVWFYLYKALWPVDLSFVYPRWATGDVPAAAFLPPAALAAGFAALLVLRRRPWARAALVGLGYFVVSLAPVLGFFDIYFMRYSLVADHWQYFALPGVIALIVGGGWHFAHRRGAGGLRLAAGVSAAVVVCLCVLTWRQSRMYDNTELLFRRTLARNPGCWMAHTNLGNIVALQGKKAEAMEHFHHAVRLNPDCYEAINSLGNLLMEQDKVEEAVGNFRRAVALRGDWAGARGNLGYALVKQGKYDEAIQHLQEAVRLKGDFAEARCNLGLALMSKNRFPEAIEHLREAVRLSPWSLDAHTNLATAYLAEGNVEDAIRHSRLALRIAPNSAKAHDNLGSALVEQGKCPQAVEQFQLALRSDPSYYRARYNWAGALTKQGKLPEAVEQYQEALRIKPDLFEAHFGLGAISTTRGRFAEAVGHFRRAIQLRPDHAQTCNNLAWLLATHATLAGANPAEAVELAQRAIQLNPQNELSYLDTLAAAYAAAGRFPEAVAAAEKAIRLAEAVKQAKLAEEIRGRLVLYKANQPYVEPEP